MINFELDHKEEPQEIEENRKRLKSKIQKLKKAIKMQLEKSEW